MVKLKKGMKGGAKVKKVRPRRRAALEIRAGGQSCRALQIFIAFSLLASNR